MAVPAAEVAGAAAGAVAKNVAVAGATKAATRGTRWAGSGKVKSPKIAGVDVAMILATTGLGVAVSWIGTGRWARLKRAYFKPQATPNISGGSDRNQLT